VKQLQHLDSASPRWLSVTSVPATSTLANRTVCALQRLPATPPFGCAPARILRCQLTQCCGAVALQSGGKTLLFSKA
jgi:hypothetical protein